MSAITFSGPFFRDSTRVMKDAVKELEREVTAEAVESVKDQLFMGHGVRSGKFRASVTGQVSQTRHGIVYARDAVKGPWLESGAGSRYGSTRFRGYSMFRRGRDRTQGQVTRIADRVIDHVVRKLN